jgi:tetratricopeptide (TPR) repeat protein
MKLNKLFKIGLNFILGLFLGAGLFFIFYQITSYYQYHQNLHTKLDYWKKVTAQNPQYPDGWIKLAEIWYNLDQKELAELAIKKAQRLDPINEKFKNLH